MVKKKNRPIIVSIIAIFHMIIGVFFIFAGGVMFLAVIGLFGEEFATYWESFWAGALGSILIIVAGVVLLIGFLIFLLGYGLWGLKLVAWFVSVILYGLATLSLLLDYQTLLAAFQAGQVSSLISPLVTIGLFIYFLTVKDHFN